MKKSKISLDDDFIKADLSWYQSQHALGQTASSAQQQSQTQILTTAASANEQLAPSTLVTTVPESELSGSPFPSGSAPQAVVDDAIVVNTPAVVVPNDEPPKPASLDRTPPCDLLSDKSRSPSIPLREVVSPSLKRNAPSEQDVDSGSPAIPSSISRRRSPASDTTKTKNAAANPSQPPESASLPPPLRPKQKVKKRKGPPGLKVLPIRPEEQIRVDSAMSTLVDTVTATMDQREPEVVVASTLQSTSPIPQPPPIREAIPPHVNPQIPSETEASASTSAPAFVPVSEETTNVVALPDAMDIDETERPPTTIAISSEDTIEELADKAEVASAENTVMSDPQSPAVLLTESVRAPLEQEMGLQANIDTIREKEHYDDTHPVQINAPEDSQLKADNESAFLDCSLHLSLAEPL